MSNLIPQCESGAVSGSCYNSDDIPSWESLTPVANILDSGSSVGVFGCRIISNGNLALDMTSESEMSEMFVEHFLNLCLHNSSL